MVSSVLAAVLSDFGHDQPWMLMTLNFKPKFGGKMSFKTEKLIALLLAWSRLRGVCARAAMPVSGVPVATEAPAALDIPAQLARFWASVPADKGYGSISAAKLSEELTGKAPFLVDVREPAEVEKDGYIDGAVNIPVRTLLQNLDKLPGLDEPIVIYCGSGHRGAFGLEALKMLGYTNVRNLGGGLSAWKKANLPDVTGQKPPEPQAKGSPIIADEQLYTKLNDFLTNLPDGFYTIKADALNTELAEKPPFLVDVRSQAEWDKGGYIKGATHIPFPDFLSSLDKFPAEKDARIVVYCASGHRGAMAEMALYLLGYTNVVNLNGGLGAWVAAGLPVKK
jgi:rhodanese-related sulfurtransferase